MYNIILYIAMAYICVCKCSKRIIIIIIIKNIYCFFLYLVIRTALSFLSL